MIWKTWIFLEDMDWLEDLDNFLEDTDFLETWIFVEDAGFSGRRRL